MQCLVLTDDEVERHGVKAHVGCLGQSVFLGRGAPWLNLYSMIEHPPRLIRCRGPCQSVVIGRPTTATSDTRDWHAGLVAEPSRETSHRAGPPTGAVGGRCGGDAARPDGALLPGPIRVPRKLA